MILNNGLAPIRSKLQNSSDSVQILQHVLGIKKTIWMSGTAVLAAVDMGVFVRPPP